MANPATHGLIRDRYEPLSVLGHGAQGEVYKARDTQHDRLVALKVRPVPQGVDRQGLLAEARILLSLRPHPNLPVVRDDFFWEGSYVLVMDWIEGYDLGRLLARTGDPGLPLPSVVNWLSQAADALLHLHTQDVIHGDVKPSNLVLTSDGRVVLVDFGISRGRNEGGRRAMGSPGYCAPELLSGELGPAADVYGLAATAVALLTGSPPSVGRPDWTGVPAAAAVERALRRGLATDAARRPHSPVELLERLRANLALDLPTGVVTFLATDIDDSVRRWDEDPDVMAGLATEHDAILTESVERAGGRLLRTRGEAEATLSVFTKATDAVAAALAAQRSLARDLGLTVRMAIHSGEAEISQNDYVGRAVNRATLLRTVASGGQVVLSLASADLVTDALPPAAHLVSAGYHDLPGLARGERVFHLRHPDLAGWTGVAALDLTTGAGPRAAPVTNGNGAGLGPAASGNGHGQGGAGAGAGAGDGDRFRPAADGRGHGNGNGHGGYGAAVGGNGAGSADGRGHGNGNGHGGYGAAVGGNGAATGDGDRYRPAADRGYGNGSWAGAGNGSGDGDGYRGGTDSRGADNGTGTGTGPRPAENGAPANGRGGGGHGTGSGAAGDSAGPPAAGAATSPGPGPDSGGDGFDPAAPGSGAGRDGAGAERGPGGPAEAEVDAAAREALDDQVDPFDAAFAADRSSAGQHPADAITLIPPSHGSRRRPFGLPSVLSSAVDTDFVGRQTELDTLAEAWADARSGRRRLVLLTGEPGIGKTFLAARLASVAQAAGAAVLYGRCDEGLQVPYQPFAAALGQVLDHAEAVGRPPELGRLGGELARLAPDVVSLVPDLPPALRADPETEQFRLFEAVVLWLRALAEQAPVVLVLDDLHWATRATLLLMSHLMREDAGSRLLVVGTYRDSEVGRDHPLAPVLSDLRRVPGASRLSLGGLDEAAVLTLVERGAGRDLGEDGAGLARFIQGQTDGNPFFVREVLRHLVETGGLVRAGDGRWEMAALGESVSVPDGVRDVVGRRLARLAASTAATLEVASVIGMEFELRVLAAVGPAEEEATLAALDESVAARLIQDAGGGRFRFAHALVRSAVVDGLARAVRSRAHLRVAEAIERVHAADLEPHLAELAMHYAEAAVAGDGTKAVAYACQAGDVAVARLAFDEAVVCFRLARDLLATTASPVDEQERCRLLIRLGEAESRAGLGSARETLLEAAAIAERWRDPNLLAAAALIGMLNAGIPAFPDPERVAVLEAALEQAGDEVSTVRARLSAHLGLALVATSAFQRRRLLSDEAVRIARELGGPELLAEVLVLRSLTLVEPDSYELRQAAATEQLALAGELRDPALAGHVAIIGVAAAVDAGDLPLAWSRLNRAKHLAEEVGQPVLRWQALVQEARLAALEDRLDDAEELARAGFEHGRLVSHSQATLALQAQVFMIRNLQGRLAELVPRMRRMIDDTDLPGVVRASALDAVVAAGDFDAARPAFEALVTPERVEMTRSGTWVQAVLTLAGVCAELGDTERAAVLARELVPHQDRFIVERYTFGGHVSFPLGRLHALLEEWDEAEVCFARAEAAYLALGSQSSVAACRLARAEALLCRGRQADEECTAELITSVLEITNMVGLPTVADRAWRIRQALGVVARRPGRGDGEGTAESTAPREPLLGRSAELDRLRRVWERALEGRPGVVLVTGEPGVGKSRLAGEVVDRARAADAPVFRVRCQPGSSPYQPFVELLQAVCEQVTDDQLPRLLGRLGPELVRLLPELADRLPEGSVPTVADAATERYRLFDAVAGWMRAMTARRPLLLVIDDLHFAGSPTLQLLRHLTSTLADQMLLVIGLYSDALVGRDHPLSDLLADLHRRPGSERIHLAGLDVEATTELLTWASGLPMDDEGRALAGELHRDTEGNAFLLREVLVHLSRSGVAGGGPGAWQRFPSGQSVAVPDTVREVVGQRIRPLSPGAIQVLAAVAVAGRELSLDLLGHAVDLDPDELPAAVAEAVAARVLREVATAPPRYRFVHGLVRDTFYDQLPPAERAARHLRLAQALELRIDDDGHLAELGRHFALAGTDPLRAADYVAREGDALLASLATDEAAVAYRQALALLDGSVDPAGSAHRRAEIMVALGRAQRRGADATYRDTLLQAAAAARALGDGQLLVQAALALNDEYITVAGLLDDRRLSLLREAVVAVGDADTVERALLLAYVSVEQMLVSTLQERDALSAEAVAIARRVGDPRTLAVCLGQRAAAIAHASTVEVRRRLVVEQAELASRLSDISMLVQTDFQRYQLELSDGNVAEADRLAARAGMAVSTLGGPAFRRSVAGLRGVQAFLAGRFDDADQAFTESFELGLETGHPMAFVIYAAQLGTLRFFQGRLRELDGLLAGVRAVAPGLDVFRVAMGASLAEAGHLAEARVVLDEIAADGFDRVGGGVAWLDAVALCARLCYRLGDADRARTVVDLLRPYAGRFVADGPLCLGPVDHYLGLALSAVGETREAIALLRRAVDRTERLGIAAFATRARLDLARVLLGTGQASEVIEAQELLTAAMATGSEVGMGSVVAEARELADRLVRAALPPCLMADTAAAGLPSRAGARAALSECWDRARDGGRELVLITAPGGGGATPLAARVAGSAYDSGAAVFAGHCDDRGRVSLAPFREMFTEAVANGHLDADLLPPDVARLAGGPVINDGLPFGNALTVMFDDSFDNPRAAFLEHVVSCLQGMAGLRPLVLVLEGLEAADRATMLIIERLLRHTSLPGLLIVGTATSTKAVSDALGGDIAGIAATAARVSEVLVPAVTTEDAEALLRVRRPQESPARVAALAPALVKASGGCFFALEVLLDEFVAAGRVPGSPDEVILGRLSRLGAFGMEALAAGAVAGDRFTTSVVEHMLGRADGSLAAQFRRAVQLGLLAGGAQGGDHFWFTNPTVRTAALGALSPGERARLHRLAARAVEAVAPPAELTAHAEELAYHHLVGGSRVGEDRAASWLVTAGEVACRVHSYELAERLWDEALEILDQTGTDRHVRRAQLLAYLGRLRLLLGVEPGRAIAESTDALDLYDRVGDTRRAAMVHAHLGTVRGAITGWEVVDIDAALAHFGAAEDTLGSADDAAGDVFQLNWAHVALRGLRLGDAAAHARTAVTGAARRRDTNLTGRAEVVEALVEWELGRLDEAAARLEAIASQTVVRPGLARVACWSRSYTLLISGDPRAALDWADRALAIPGLGDTPRAERWLHDARYRCLWELGRLAELPARWTGGWPGATAVRRPDENGDSVAQLLAHYGAQGDRLSQVAYSVPTAGSLRRRVGPDRARNLLVGALATAEASGARTLEYLLRAELVIVDPLLGRTELEKARRLVGDGRSWAPLVSALDHADAVLRGVEGDEAGAEASFSRALKAFRAAGRPWAELTCLLDRADARAKAGDIDGSAADRTRAIVAVRALGGASGLAG